MPDFNSPQPPSKVQTTATIKRFSRSRRTVRRNRPARVYVANPVRTKSCGISGQSVLRSFVLCYPGAWTSPPHLFPATSTQPTPHQSNFINTSLPVPQGAATKSRMAMTNEQRNDSKIEAEIKNLRVETQHLNRPFYKRIDFWAVVLPVLSLVALTIWDGYFSPISKLERQEFQTNKAGLELELKNLEGQRTRLEIDVSNLRADVTQFEGAKAALYKENEELNLEKDRLSKQVGQSEVTKTALSEENEKLIRENDGLVEDIRQHEATKVALAHANSELERDNTTLGTQNTTLRTSNQDLQQHIGDSERELNIATERLVCREIDFSIRAIKDLAYSLAAPSDRYNFSALSTIAERENYLARDVADDIEGLGYDFWYVNWKDGVPWFGDDAMARSIAAQTVAQIVVGAIDVGSFFSPFSDGTNADRDYPLSRLIGLAIDRVENEEAKSFLMTSMDSIRAKETPRKSSLMPNLTNDAIRAVSELVSNQVYISRDHVVEFSMEMLRVREAHREAQVAFSNVMHDFERKCDSS